MTVRSGGSGRQPHPEQDHHTDCDPSLRNADPVGGDRRVGGEEQVPEQVDHKYISGEDIVGLDQLFPALGRWHMDCR